MLSLTILRKGCLPMKKNKAIIDLHTGEILSPIKEGDIVVRRKSIESYHEKKLEQQEFSTLQEEYCGRFIFFLFNNLDKITNILNDVELVKYVYLATYIKKGGVLQLDNNLTNINNSTMQKLLKMSRNKFNIFLQKIIENKLIYKDDNKYYINLDYFYQGNIKEYKKLTGKKIFNFTRMYVESTRNIFEQLDYRGHRKLSILYKLVPYISWKYNVLCKNIYETEESKILPLTMKEILEITGQHPKNITRFKKDLGRLLYNGYAIFGMFQNYNINGNNKCIVINPLFFNRNSNHKQLDYLLSLFKIK